jgi:hypothetical protein
MRARSWCSSVTLADAVRAEHAVAAQEACDRRSVRYTLGRILAS